MTCEYKDYDKYGPRLFSSDGFYLRAHGVGCLGGVVGRSGNGF